MVIDKIVGVVNTVIGKCLQDVKGVVIEVPAITIGAIKEVISNADITPQDLYVMTVEDGKPFTQLGIKEQIIYNTVVAVIREFIGMVNEYEGEKADMQKEIDEAKKQIATTDSKQFSKDENGALDWSGLQADGGQPIQ